VSISAAHCTSATFGAITIAPYAGQREIMENNNIDMNVARLDGYLGGVLSLSGSIRGYSAHAYVLNQDAENSPIDKLITDAFAPQATFVFDSIESLGGGLSELESSIQPYLLKFLLGLPDETFANAVIVDRKKYLSFVIMDLIDPIVNAHGNAVEVIRLIEKCKKTETHCIFFCILVNNFYLVLQFNDNQKIGVQPSSVAPADKNEMKLKL
jgi:hypothetical protein